MPNVNYQTLGDASKADIKNTYFRLAHRYHPDHHNHADATARAKAARRFRQAYDVLSDGLRRADYDRNLRHSSSSSSSGYRTSSSSSASSSSSKQGNRQGGASSSSSLSSSKHGNRHKHGRSRPRGGSKLQSVFVGAYVVLMVLEGLAEVAREWESMERDVETIKRQIEKMKIELQMRKRRWENMKQEWEKKNPWKSWMESREKEKKKNWWTDIFRS